MSRIIAQISRRRLWIWTLATYVVSQGVLALGALVRIPLLVDNLGPAGYGQFTAIFSVWPILAILADGMAQSVRAVVSNRATSNAGYAVTRFFQFGLLQCMILTASISLPSVVLLAIYGSRIDTPLADEIWSIAIIAFTVAICVPIAVSKGALDALGKTAFSNLSLAANTLLGLPILIVGFHVSQSLVSAVVASAIGNATPYIATAIYLKVTLAHNRGYGSWNFGKPQMLDRNNYSILKSMTFYATANLMAYGFDPLIISVTSGDVQTGEYGLASRVMMIAMFVPLGMTGLLTTKYSLVRKTGDLDAARTWLRTMSFRFTGLGAILCAVSLSVAPPIGDLLSGGKVNPSQSLYMALAAFSFLSIASCPYMCSFTERRAAQVRAQAAFFAGLLNVGLSVIGSIFLGATGAVLASVAANAVMLVYLLVRTTRDSKLVLAQDADLEITQLGRS